MPYPRYLDARCDKCGQITAVTEMYWPATRLDPADGEYDVEECGECGAEFDDSTAWAEAEPPDPY